MVDLLGIKWGGECCCAITAQVALEDGHLEDGDVGRRDIAVRAAVDDVVMQPYQL